MFCWRHQIVQLCRNMQGGVDRIGVWSFNVASRRRTISFQPSVKSEVFASTMRFYPKKIENFQLKPKFANFVGFIGSRTTRKKNSDLSFVRIKDVCRESLFIEWVFFTLFTLFHSSILTFLNFEFSFMRKSTWLIQCMALIKSHQCIEPCFHCNKNRRDLRLRFSYFAWFHQISRSSTPDEKVEHIQLIHQVLTIFP